MNLLPNVNMFAFRFWVLLIILNSDLHNCPIISTMFSISYMKVVTGLQSIFLQFWHLTGDLRVIVMITYQLSSLWSRFNTACWIFWVISRGNK